MCVTSELTNHCRKDHKTIHCSALDGSGQIDDHIAEWHIRAFLSVTTWRNGRYPQNLKFGTCKSRLDLFGRRKSVILTVVSVYRWSGLKNLLLWYTCRVSSYFFWDVCKCARLYRPFLAVVSQEAHSHTHPTHTGPHLYKNYKNPHIGCGKKVTLDPNVVHEPKTYSQIKFCKFSNRIFKITRTLKRINSGFFRQGRSRKDYSPHSIRYWTSTFYLNN